MGAESLWAENLNQETHKERAERLEQRIAALFCVAKDRYPHVLSLEAAWDAAMLEIMKLEDRLNAILVLAEKYRRELNPNDSGS